MWGLFGGLFLCLVMSGYEVVEDGGELFWFF